MENEKAGAFVEALREYFRILSTSLPSLLALLVIIALGVAIGWLLKIVVREILKALGFDRLLYRTGLAALLEKGNVKKQPSELVGAILFWILVFVSILAGLEAINVEAVDRVGQGFLTYLPHLALAIFIFIVGYLLMIFVGRTVLIAAVNARLRFAKLLSVGVQVIIMAFTIAMTVEELGIATSIIIVTFSIVFGGLILALAIAFGLGGRDLAKGWMEKRFGKDFEREEETDEFSHL
ncbi:MAG: hypothetical protein AMJ46_03295 [Latescibacteria bacterium DG_63]|nr:MAG: hypothetical protein AMJ46_03295 [Latescibacteria bacterium DG_63]